MSAYWVEDYRNKNAYKIDLDSVAVYKVVELVCAGDMMSLLYETSDGMKTQHYEYTRKNREKLQDEIQPIAYWRDKLPELFI